MVLLTICCIIYLFLNRHKFKQKTFSADELLQLMRKFDLDFRFKQKYARSVLYKRKKKSDYDLINDDLLNLPMGTLGRDFYEWLGRNNESTLTLYNRYRNKNDNKIATDFKKTWCLCHDLQHFFTGYDTSKAGEVMMIAYTLKQEFRPSGVALIFVGCLQRVDFKKFKRLFLLLREAYKLGNKKWFPTLDWEQLFKQRTVDVKKELGFNKKPELYLQNEEYLNKKYKGEIA